MKLFFYRLDYIRIACIVLVLPAILFDLYSPLAFRYFYIFTPLTILIALGALFLFPFKRPKDDKILADISAVHQNYLLKIRNENRNSNTSIVLEGFSPTKRHLARRIGSQRIFPVLRSIVFLQQENAWTMHIKDTYLAKKKGAISVEKVYSFDTNHPATLHLLKYDEKTQSIFLSFVVAGDTVQVISRIKFRIKELCDSVKGGFILTDEMAKFLK